MTRYILQVCSALVVLGATGSAAFASAGAELVQHPGLWAATGYWGRFLEYWKNAIFKQNSIVLGAVVLGAVCIFILTRTKAKN